MMVSRLQLSAAVAVDLINHEDDFLLLASSKEELEQMIVALRAAVRNLPGGRFSLKAKSQGHLDEISADFLGHSIRRKSGKTVVTFNTANHEHFFSVLKDFKSFAGGFKLNKADTYDQQRLRHCYQLRDYLKAWHQAFYLCGSDAIELREMGDSDSTTEVIARHRTLACKGFEVRSDAVSSARPKRGRRAFGTAMRK